ncbi:MAG: MASE1 domain-containing protein [Candidatus Cloacimonetes bacterium]|nr:MASE1 domain-containing protein [Candidatus Cloacimonadota bacterium]
MQNRSVDQLKLDIQPDNDGKYKFDTHRVIYPRIELSGIKGSLREILSLFLVFLSYYLAAKLGLFYTLKPVGIALLWPSNAILLTVILMTQPRNWWKYFLAVIPAELLADLPAGIPLGGIFVFLLGDFLEVTLAATLLNRFVRAKFSFSCLKNTLHFILFAVILGPMAGAAIGGFLPFAAGYDIGYWDAFLRWFLGDGLTHLTVTSFLLIWLSKPSENKWSTQIGEIIEGVIISILLLVSSSLATGLLNPPGLTAPILLYFIFPILLWITIRFGPRGALTALLFLTNITILNFLMGRGPFTGGVASENIVHLQLFLTFLLSPIMILAALMEERKINLQNIKIQKKYFESLFQLSPSAVVILDNEENIMRVNDQFLNLFGYTQEEVAGKKINSLIVPDHLQAEGERATLSVNEGEQINFESIRKRKDGSLVEVDIFGMPLVIDGKKIAIHALYRDISVRKRNEEIIKQELMEKEILLKEVHHRVKNNMQIISSLINMQSTLIKKDEVKQLFLDSKNRVKTMALIHEKLYQTEDFSRIEFGDYIRRLISDLMKSYRVDSDRIKLIISIENISMDINIAVPCGLIINELISNAIKYAFPGDRSGTLQISLVRQNDDNFEMTVTDDGIGLPSDFDVNKTESLGLQLVHALVNQLHGRIDINGRDGLQIKICFKDVSKKISDTVLKKESSD